MDPLSHLVTLLDPRGRMELRCLFGASFAAPHGAVGPWLAPFHVVLRGECELLLVDLKTNVADAGRADIEILCGEFEFRGRRRSALLEALPECLVVEFSERPEFGWLQGLLRMMAHEIEHQDAGAAAIVAELSGAVFTLAVRAHLETQPGQAGVLGLMANPRLAPALAAMLESPGQAWTVESLAARCNLSRAAFARLFSRDANTAPLELLTSLRMELANSVSGLSSCSARSRHSQAPDPARRQT